MGLLQRLYSVFERYPQHYAFCIEDQQYTYKELYANVYSIVARLAVIDTGQNIGIYVQNDLETYASLLAILFTGKTYVPIQPGYPAERIAQIADMAGLRYALGAKHLAALPGLSLISYESDYAGNWADATITFSYPDVDERNVNAYILFTSGSTGVPKGVQISYHNVCSLITASDDLFPEINENDRFLQMADLTFDLSVFSYFFPLSVGACVCTVPTKGIKFASLYHVLESQQVTFGVMVPSALNHLRPYFNEINLPNLRHCLFCGEPLYKDIMLEWIRCAPNVIIDNVYGPTEATVFCLAYPVTDPENVVSVNEIVGIGTPIKNMEVLVVDEDLQPLTDGEKGELCLSGDQLTPGYLDEEKNKISFFEAGGRRYYRTGDIVFKGEQGMYIFCGRADNQVKIQGYRIELSEIEFHLRKIAGAKGCVAVVRKGKNGMNQVEAVFENRELDPETLMAELKKHLPMYLMPSKIHLFSPFPINANGKTDRNALAGMLPEVI